VDSVAAVTPEELEAPGAPGLDALGGLAPAHAICARKRGVTNAKARELGSVRAAREGAALEESEGAR
jgi:hypothetical protein